MTFTPYSGRSGGLGLVLEAALGVDPDSDSSTWTWEDLTALRLVHHPEKIILTHGRANRTSQADPSSITFTLLNLNGEFTSPTGAYTKYLVRNLPFRVRVNGFGTSVGGTGYHRGTAFLASARPRWDPSLNAAVVDVVAQGRLRRLQQRTDVLKSAAFTAIQRMPANTGFAKPVAHWPFEDESTATSAASAVAGVNAATVSGMTFAADSSIVGAAPLAKHTSSSAFTATVPTYTSTGTFTVMFCASMPNEPAAATVLVDIATTGSASLWRVIISPGAPSTFLLQAWGGGSLLLSTSSPLTESAFYTFGHWYAVTITQSGTGIAYSATAYNSTGIGGSVSGTLASNTAGSVIGLSTYPQAGLTDTVFGHLAVHIQPGAEGGFTRTAVLLANATDWPWERFQRICQEQNVPYTVDASDNQDLEMGPQAIDTFLNVARECETVEGCVLNDSGEFGGATGLLWFPARDDRENRAATMTLNMASGHVAGNFDPTLDDQDIVNDFEASRPDGSTARVRDETSIAKEGQYRQGETFNTNDDSFLAHLAGWRVNLGTQTGMRFPAVSWNLRRAPDLAEQWVACRLFHRIDITNPPPQYPPDTIQAILEGYTETFATDEWTVTANLSPYKPNKIGVVASDTGDTAEYILRLAGDDKAAIRTAITSSAATIDFDPNLCRWTTRLVQDDAGRTASNSWGSPDFGPSSWTVSGTGASVFSVSGGKLLHSISVVNDLEYSHTDTGYVDHINSIDYTLPVVPTGAAITLGAMARVTDTSNHYVPLLIIGVGGAATLRLDKRVLGAASTIVSAVSVGTHSAGNTWRIVVQAWGSLIRAKAWKPATDVDPGWQVSTTDTDLTTGTRIGVRNRLETGNTNTTPVVISMDSVAVTSSEGSNVDDFPLVARLGGETVTVSGIGTTPVSFVNAGTNAHADNAAVTPGMYTGAAANDVILVLAAVRSASAATISITTGYTRLPVWPSTANIQLYAKVHTGSESDPTITPSGGSAGDAVSAFTFGLRGAPCSLANLADLVVDSAIQSNAAAQNIAYPGLYPWLQEGCFVLVIGHKDDDWTSVATLSGMTEMRDISTPLGNQQGLVVDYVIQTRPALVAEGSFVVTGGASAVSRSAAIAIAGGYQTMTVTRSANTVSKAQTARTLIEVENALVLGM